MDKVRKLHEEHGPDSLKVGMGAEAIRELLRDMDLDSLARDLRAQMLGETSVRSARRSSSASRSSRRFSSPATSRSG